MKAVDVLAVGLDRPAFRLEVEKYGRPVALTADRRFLLAVGKDRTVTLWDMTAGKEVFARQLTEDYVYGCAVSPDGKTVAALSGPGLPKKPRERWSIDEAVAHKTTLRAWDVTTGKELYHVPDWHGRHVAFAPGGARFVSTHPYHTDILVGDAKTGRLLHRMKGHGTTWLMGLAFSADGKRLASGSRDHSAIIWDLTTGKAALDFDSPRGPVSTVALSPDGKTVFTGCSEDHIGGLWDAETGKRRHRLDADGKGNPEVAAFTPDGKYLVAGYGHYRSTSTGDAWTARVWSVADGKVVREFGGHTDGVRTLVVSPDGKHVVTRDGGKKLRVWDFDTGKLTREVEWAHNQLLTLAFPKADALIGVAADRSHKTEVTNLLTGKTVATWQAKERQSGLTLSPCGRFVVAAEDSRERGWVIREAASGKVVSTLGTARVGSLSVAAFSSDGGLVAVSGGSGGGSPDTVRVFDTVSGRELQSFPAHAGMVCGLAFSPDGKRLATGSWDSTVLVWNLAARI